jgi:integrase
VAVVRKRGKSWQAIVRMKGAPAVSATRQTKREAEEWAKAEEAAILAGRRGKYPSRTLGEALTKYEEDVSAHKRGKVHEERRFQALRNDYPALVAKVLHTITPADLGAWRDARLKVVSKGSVQRDINLLRNVWSVAAKEWGWCEDGVWKSVRMPGDNPARTSVWRWGQIRTLLRRLHYRTGKPPALPMEQVGFLFLLGLHTAMRHGELCRLRREDVDLERRVVTLRTHKTVEAVGARQVPITRRAARVLKVLCAKTGPLFTVSPASAEALFRKYRLQVGIEGLTFHDTRGTALTLLAKRVEPLVLARISGHRDLSLLLNVYYRATAAEIAAGL